MRKSAIRPIAREIRQKVLCLTVAVSHPVTLSDADKLDALRRLDQFRQWHSLNEKRYCLVCGEIITGLQIQVAGGTRGNGGLRLSCPTSRCNSIPMDWVLPTDEILAKVERMAAEEARNTLPPAAPILVQASNALGKNEYTGFPARLRKLGFHFRQSS